MIERTSRHDNASALRGPATGCCTSEITRLLDSVSHVIAAESDKLTYLDHLCRRDQMPVALRHVAAQKAAAYRHQPATLSGPCVSMLSSCQYEDLSCCCQAVALCYAKFACECFSPSLNLQLHSDKSLCFCPSIFFSPLYLSSSLLRRQSGVLPSGALSPPT
eukprot:6211091-Pleurochrysis_carterae.AAC.1